MTNNTNNTKTDTTYNGWPNYQTWLVTLWIGNEEGLYWAAREYVRGCRRRGQLVKYDDYLSHAGLSGECERGVQWSARTISRMACRRFLQSLVEIPTPLRHR